MNWVDKEIEGLIISLTHDRYLHNQSELIFFLEVENIINPIAILLKYYHHFYSTNNLVI